MKTLDRARLLKFLRRHDVSRTTLIEEIESGRFDALCPTPTKQRFRTVEFAREAAIISAMRRPVVLFGYRCACKGWHLTSKDRWDQKRALLLARPRSGS